MSLFDYQNKDIPEWFRRLFADFVAEYPETRIDYTQRIGKYWHGLKFSTEYILRITFRDAVETYARFPSVKDLAMMASSKKRSIPIVADKGENQTPAQQKASLKFLIELLEYVEKRKSIIGREGIVRDMRTLPQDDLDALDRLGAAFIERRESVFRPAYKEAEYPDSVPF